MSTTNSYFLKQNKVFATQIIKTINQSNEYAL